MKYEMIWSDEFNQDGSIDVKKWTQDIGGHGFGNQEAQFYTNNLKNCFIKDGKLNITAIKEKKEDNQYTSAKLLSYPHFDLQYGRVEVCAKLPKGKGTWPAIWMLASSIKNGQKWPACGEIDIMEHVGRDQDVVHFSLHSEKKNFKLNNHLTRFIKIEGATDRFIEYSMNWTKDTIEFFAEGVLQARFNRFDGNQDDWPFIHPFYLILNLAIGGKWGGQIDDSIFPATFLVDYVRIYKYIED